MCALWMEILDLKEEWKYALMEFGEPLEALPPEWQELYVINLDILLSVSM